MTIDNDNPMDETDVNLRAYLENLSVEHLARYNPDWTDDEVKEWDGNFCSDGALMLVCFRGRQPADFPDEFTRPLRGTS